MSDPTPVNEVPKDPGNVTSLLLDWSQGDSANNRRNVPN
jgi:hypothetical protein